MGGGNLWWSSGSVFITDRVRSTRESYVLTRVCPQPGRGVPHLAGGTPARSSWGGGLPHLARREVPQPSLGGGYPTWPGPGKGVPKPRGSIANHVHSTREGYVLTCVCPQPGGGGYPTWPGGTPARSSWGGTPARSRQGGTPARSSQEVPPLAGVPSPPCQGVPPCTGQQM